MITYLKESTLIHYENESLNIFTSVEDFWPFRTLRKLREELEPEGVFLLCKGNRKDVWPSGGFIGGAQAYQFQIGKRVHFSDLVGIFDAEHDYTTLGTVVEQRAMFNLWLESIKGLPY